MASSGPAHRKQKTPAKVLIKILMTWQRATLWKWRMWGKFVKVLTTGQIRWQRGFLKSGDFDENGERKFTKVLAKLLMRCWKGPIRYRGDFDKNGEISPKMWRNFLWDCGDFDTKMANMAMWQKWRIWNNKQLPWVWWYSPLESVNLYG